MTHISITPEALEQVRKALLPCPFCGKEPIIDCSFGKGDPIIVKNIVCGTMNGSRYNFVCCTDNNCQARTKEFETTEAAIDAWNTRASLPTAAGEGGEMQSDDDKLPKTFERWKQHFEERFLPNHKEYNAAVAAEHCMLLAIRQPAWRPIETAPKDGKLILVTRTGYLVASARWDDNSFGGKHWIGFPSGTYPPLYWQPLPPPPTSPTPDGGDAK